MSHTITFVWAAAKSITRLPSQRLFPTAKRWAKCIIRALFYMARKCSFPPLVSKNCFAQQFSSHQRNTHRWNLFQLICNLHGLVSKFKTFTKFCSRAAISGNDWIFSDTLNLVFHLSEAYQKAFLVLNSFTRLFFTSLDPILWFCQKYFAFPCLYWRSALACNIAIYDGTPPIGDGRDWMNGSIFPLLYSSFPYLLHVWRSTPSADFHSQPCNMYDYNCFLEPFSLDVFLVNNLQQSVLVCFTRNFMSLE